MFKGLKQLAAVAAVAAGVGLAQSASAGVAPATITFDSLLEGGSNQSGITVGDKLYDNFTFSSTGQTVLAPEDVEVIVAMEGNNHYIAFLFDLTSVGDARSDLVIGYDLHVIDADRHIKGVGLLFDGGPFDIGPVQAAAVNGVPPRSLSAASVVETVSTLDGSDLVAGGLDQDTEIISVFNDGEGVLIDNMETTLAINPQRGLRFTKDIMVSSRGLGASQITTVENSVEQNGTVIPLPAAFWAAMPILGGLVAGKKVRTISRRK
jgi:hypothetical protein